MDQSEPPVDEKVDSESEKKFKLIEITSEIRARARDLCQIEAREESFKNYCLGNRKNVLKLEIRPLQHFYYVFNKDSWLKQITRQKLLATDLIKLISSVGF